MKKILKTIFIYAMGGMVLITSLVFLLISIKLLFSDMSDNVKIALITVVGALLTIIGSMVIVFLTQKANIKEKKAADIRDIKLKYYHKFCEAYVNKHLYMGKENCIESVEANMEFIREVNRLPLYASNEMIAFIEKIKNPDDAKDTKFDEMYILIRDDLNSDEFKRFNKDLETSLAISDKVIIQDKEGNKKIL